MKDKLLKTFTDEDLSDTEDYPPTDSRYMTRRIDPILMFVTNLFVMKLTKKGL